MGEEHVETRNTSRYTIPLLVMALIVSLAWGYTQFRAKRSWEIRAENQYNRSFSELALHVGDLRDQLGKAMVSNSPKKLREYFTDIWRQANFSQEDIGQLPLAAVELSRTKNFLATVAAFCYRQATREFQGETGAMEEKDWKTLASLHHQATYLSQQLTDLQERVLEGEERWLDVDRIDMASMAADVSERLNTNNVTKGFMMLEDGFKRLPEADIEGNLLNFKPTPKGLIGPKVNVEQARETALRLAELDGEAYRAVYEGQSKGDFPVYMFRLTKREEAEKNRRTAAPVLRMAMSMQGGHLVWLLKERDVDRAGLSLEEGAKRCQEYLEKRGFPNMEVIAVEEFRNTAMVSLAAKEGDTVVQPDLIKCKVALDNGEIIGVDTIAYLTFHDPNRRIPQPRLTQDEVRKKVNPHLKIDTIEKVVILNDQFKETLCYEVGGTLEKNRYLVYINALTGEEERIKQVDQYGNEVS
ncbi:MAG TPA: germination protein YpeB [Bacillota bacterium]